MKKKILAAMGLLPLIALAQKPFAINGELKTLKAGSKIYLIYTDNGKRKVDSAIIINGKFRFKGILNSPAAMGGLYLNRNPIFNPPSDNETLNELTIYIEPGEFKLTAQEALKDAIIQGSLINDEAKELKNMTTPYYGELDSIIKEVAGLSNEQKHDTALLIKMKKRWDSAAKTIDDNLFLFASSHPKSFLSLNAIKQLIL